MSSPPHRQSSRRYLLIEVPECVVGARRSSKEDTSGVGKAKSSIQQAQDSQVPVQEKSLTAQYIKKNSEIRSRKRKAERGQVVRINKEEIHG